jgi:hypothetical protein
VEQFTQKLQGVTTQLEESRAECTELRSVGSSAEEGSSALQARLQSQLASHAGQIDELKGTLEHERESNGRKTTQLAGELEVTRAAAAKGEALAKQQKEEADMTIESMRTALTMQMDAGAATVTASSGSSG